MTATSTPLWGYFSTDPEQVCAALDALERGSHGEVESPELHGSVRGWPAPRGLLCPRVFGPVEDDSCLCGRVTADPSQRGTTCARCGVPIGPAALRAARWGHVSLPLPVRHPAGVDVTRFALPPPAARPLGPLTNPASGRLRPANPTVPGRDTVALQRLVLRATRLRRLLEINAPQVIVDHEAKHLQRAVADAHRLLSLPLGHPDRTPTATSLWAPPDDDAGPLPPDVRLAPPPPPDLDDEEEEESPLAVCWLRDERVLLQWPARLEVRCLPSGRVERSLPGTELVLLGAQGPLALFGDRYGVETCEGVLHGVGVLDTVAGSWRSQLPADLPVVLVHKAQPEEAWLQDLRTGRSAAVAEDCSGDRPAELARSPDLRFVWVSSSCEDGVLQSLETAQTHVRLSRLRLEDQLQEDDDQEDDDEWPDEIAVAFCRDAANQWRILDAWRGVSVDGVVCSRLPFQPTAAAFSRCGSRLVAADARRLIVWEVEAGGAVVDLTLGSADC